MSRTVPNNIVPVIRRCGAKHMKNMWHGKEIGRFLFYQSRITQAVFCFQTSPLVLHWKQWLDIQVQTLLISEASCMEVHLAWG